MANGGRWGDRTMRTKSITCKVAGNTHIANRPTTQACWDYLQQVQRNYSYLESIDVVLASDGVVHATLSVYGSRPFA